MSTAEYVAGENDGFDPVDGDPDGDGDSEEETEYDVTQKIVLHVYNDESKEFTGLTTYHGMVRIYNSNTWPSLIFWCLVVVSNVSLFMLHSGLLLQFYNSRPTFFDTKHIKTNIPSNLIPSFTFCQKNDVITDTILSQNEANCEHFLQHVAVNHRTINVCQNHVQVIRTGYGLCFKMDHLPLALSDQLTVIVKAVQGKEIAFAVSTSKTVPNLFSTGVHVPDGIQLNGQLFIQSQKFLDSQHWGNCRDNADDVNHCENECIMQKISQNCSCLPFKNDGNIRQCSTETDRLCVRQTIDFSGDCQCQLPCQRNVYEIVDRSMLKLPTKGISKNQRFRTVDVLSFVGGSMGLFLGMSCITLLEVFMFLFKSIWGIINDQRHKDYLSNLLGETVTGLLGSGKNDVHGSHEKIIITQTNNQIDVESNDQQQQQQQQQLKPITLQFVHNGINKKYSIQFGPSQEDNRYPSLLKATRFRAHSNRSIISSVDYPDMPTRNAKLARDNSYKSIGLGDF